MLKLAAEQRDRVPVRSRPCGRVRRPRRARGGGRGLPDPAPGGWALYGSRSVPFDTRRRFQTAAPRALVLRLDILMCRVLISELM